MRRSQTSAKAAQLSGNRVSALQSPDFLPSLTHPPWHLACQLKEALTGLCVHARCRGRTTPALPLPESAKKTTGTVAGGWRANMTAARVRAVDQKAPRPHERTSRLHTDPAATTDAYWRACDAARHDGMLHLVQMQRLLLRKRQANQFRKGSTGQAGTASRRGQPSPFAPGPPLLRQFCSRALYIPMFSSDTTSRP